MLFLSESLAVWQLKKMCPISINDRKKKKKKEIENRLMKKKTELKNKQTHHFMLTITPHLTHT